MRRLFFVRYLHTFTGPHCALRMRTDNTAHRLYALLGRSQRTSTAHYTYAHLLALPLRPAPTYLPRQMPTRYCALRAPAATTHAAHTTCLPLLFSRYRVGQIRAGNLHRSATYGGAATSHYGGLPVLRRYQQSFTLHDANAFIVCAMVYHATVCYTVIVEENLAVCLTHSNNTACTTFGSRIAL